MSGKKNLFFVHIPCNAGEFVKKNYGYAVASSDDFEHLNTFSKFHKSLGDYTPFCVVRNPYERLQTVYQRQSQKNTEEQKKIFPTFEHFILAELFNANTLKERTSQSSHNKSIAKRTMMQGLVLDPSYLFTQNIPKENFIKFETLQGSLTEFLNKHNIEVGDNWDKVNKTKRKTFGGWTNQMKNVVQNFYKLDFETYGYSDGI